MPSPSYEYVANLHVHTTFSDGQGEIDGVISAAQKAGLDLLLINDHNTLTALEKGYEGYHGRVLVLVGLEFSGRHNHYLAYGLKKVPEFDWQEPQDFIQKTKAAGGIGFLAHPFEKGSPYSEGGKAFTWEDWSVNGFNGLCLWNYSSIWKSQAQSLRQVLWHYFVRAKTLPGPEKETLAKWDEIGQARPVSAVGGSDAHAFSYGIGPLKLTFFPYKYLFKAINTHVLLPESLSGDLDKNRAAVYKALAAGSCFVGHDRLKKTKGFNFLLENKGEKKAGQGEEVTFATEDQLVWSLPARTEARLYRNGQVILKITARDGRFQVPGPGVYRLEASWPSRFFGPRPWIFSNHIYLRP
ncbi:MAG: CehA/McbA family metallohydrolase [Deltaproteobacteria bacterium]|nr:CehA/McbA family metallohydrolase [Deltaproteobacteria bacterium]MBW2051676.1 CehA/McbA family metallohydrolase [Deltaproteobacteria bacterium]MBW2140198.1 CehA/McbA family metallohydrolase [Deltaproteobacteria bacterium]MBW2323914.1 CehA/McbA family metallohydrolase [Deltaproteobacteria bacterium]